MTCSPRVLLALAFGHASSYAVGDDETFFSARVAPIMEQHCVLCHGEEKQKAELRLDSFERMADGSEYGKVVAPGDPGDSELYFRITLPHDDEDVMPSDGKPLLSADEIKVIELWIEAGASPSALVANFPNAPLPAATRLPAAPPAPDWHPQAGEIAALQTELGLKFVPRSLVPTDGLVLRTASSPQRCDDEALAKLAPVAELIVEAELARTAVSDIGMAALAKCANLRKLDLTQTRVTSDGLAQLASLDKLEALNLTETKVDETGLAYLEAISALEQVWLFGTKAASVAAAKP